ncbi:MAG: hypothetical protein Q9168_004213 [Polycauliona sp. 1 TL-2023]
MAHQPDASPLAPHVSAGQSYEKSRTAESPLPQALPSNTVIIKHPGYREQGNLLMQFQAHDRLGEEEGIHHGTILTACRIVSGRNDGFLTKELGDVRLGLDVNGLLPQGSYYFVVPNDDNYAIYPSFPHWTFPHRQLPPGWSTPPANGPPTVPAPAHSNTTNAVLIRDKGCLVTRQRDAVERAHLCPQKQTSWFRSNRMGQYNQSRRLAPACTTDDISSLVALRKDIHFVFDQRMFVFVPKQDNWLIHFLEPSLDLGPQYHNIKATLNTGVAREHVLARFAWAIFPLVREFLEQGPKRWIRAMVTDGDGFITEENEFMDVTTITKRYFPPQKKSQKKRTRPDDEVSDESQEQEVETGIHKRRKFVQPSRVPQEEEIQVHQSSSDTLRVGKQASTSTNTAMSNQDPSMPPIKDASLPSDSDDGFNDPDPRVRHLYSGESRLDKLRRHELKRRRPYDKPELFCCDYDRRAAVVYAAIKGEGEWDEYELCDECLGGEYMPQLGDLDERDDCGQDLECEELAPVESLER